MADLGTIVDAHTVRFERLLPGPVERVWNHLTRPDLLATWLAGGELDLRVGGKVELRFDADLVPERRAAGAIVRGVVSRCDPPRALSCSWTDPAVDSAVAFDLAASGDGVRLTVAHRALPRALLAGCGAGWHAHLDVLEARLRGARPEPFPDLFRRMVPEYECRAAGLEDAGRPA
jgi:uncharacterized protein YndB with AHSA1/START domain